MLPIGSLYCAPCEIAQLVQDMPIFPRTNHANLTDQKHGVFVFAQLENSSQLIA